MWELVTMGAVVGGCASILVAAIRAPLRRGEKEHRRLLIAPMTTDDHAALVALSRLSAHVERDAWWHRPPSDIAELDRALAHWPADAHRLVWELAQDVHSRLADGSRRRMGADLDALVTTQHQPAETTRLVTRIIVATGLPAKRRIRFRARPRRIIRRAFPRP